MPQITNPKDVDAFLDNTMIGDDPALSAALAASDAAGLHKLPSRHSRASSCPC